MILSILNPKFEYVDADHTDIRLTFERIRREQDDLAYQDMQAMQDLGLEYDAWNETLMGESDGR